MPWTMKVVSLLSRMLIDRLLGTLFRIPKQSRQSCRCSLDRGDGAAGRLPHRDRAVAVLDPVALEDLEALVLPGAGDAEDRDRLARVLAELEAGLDHAAGDDVDPVFGDDYHHHGDLLDAVLFEHLLGEAAGLGDRRIAADLGVIGGLAAL